MKKFLWVPNFVWAESRLTMHSVVNTSQFLSKKKKKKEEEEEKDLREFYRNRR